MRTWLLMLLLALTTPGCAAIALPTVGMAALSGGTSGALRAGVDTTLGGTSLRTFSAPLADVRAAVLQAFGDLQIPITEDTLVNGGTARIVGRAAHREILVKLEPLTPMLTRLRMGVRESWLGRDRATAAELIEQTARALDEVRPIGAAALRRDP